MATLNTPISNLGSVTEPDKIDLNLGSASAKIYSRGVRTHFTYLPEIRAAAMANGVDPMRLSIKGNVYNLGLIPPDPIGGLPTAAGSASQATATLETASYVIADGDIISGFVNTYKPGGADYFIQFEATNGSRPGASSDPIIYVQRESATADTLQHLVNLVDGSGVKGVDYWFDESAGGALKSASEQESVLADIRNNTYIKDPATDWDGSNTLKFTAREYGLVGNSFAAALGTGTWTGSSFGTASLFAGGTAGDDNGSGPPAAGTYRFGYTYYRSGDIAESGLSALASVTIGGEQDINLSALDDGTDADYDFKRIYRTLVSGVEFYRVGEVPSGTLTYADTHTDDDLVAFGSIPYDAEAFRDYYAGHIPKYRVCAQWKGRLWGGGAILSADYTRGDADVDNDSATVNLQNGAVPTTLMIGRRFRVTNNNDAENYRIISVNESTKDIVLDRPYQGSSKDPAEYEIVDDRDTTSIGCSEPGLPNQWPADNELTGITSQDPEGIVGVVPYGDFLFWFTRDGIWRLTGESVESWQLTQVVEGVGSVMQPVTIPGGMVWLGVDGIYAWSGSGQPERISSPPAMGDRVTGIDGTIERITEAHEHLTHAVYDKEARCVRFFVPLDGAMRPTHAIVLDLGTRGTFSLDNAPGITAAGLVTDRQGNKVVVLGDEIGCLWQTGTATGSAVDYHVATAKDQGDLAIPTKDNLEGDFTDTVGRTRFRVQKRGALHKMRLACFVQGDGAFGFEGVQAVSSATARTITVGSSVFPTTGSGLAGVPVWVVRDTGSTELRKIVSNSATVLTLDRDLDYTPDSSDQIVVGGIFMDLQTGRWDLGETRRPKSWMDLWVNHTPGEAKFTGYTLAMRASGEEDV